MPRPALNLEELGDVVRAASLLDGQADRRADGWTLDRLAGRLVEVSCGSKRAGLTVAMGLVGRAQRACQPAAWVCSDEATFYPPDAARGGIDLAALPVVRVRGERRAARAADKLARSGAFGLVVVDFGSHAAAPTPLMRRLLKWAEKNQVALVCVTDRPAEAGSMSSVVSLRGMARRARVGADRFSCHLEVVRDKRGGPGWSVEEVCCGPPGLR